MGDIQNPRVLWLKFALFLAAGLLSVAIALLLYPTLRLAGLLALAIWAFCRAYYFAFYVIEHYVDPSYRYAGITSFLRYAFTRRPASNRSPACEAPASGPELPRPDRIDRTTHAD